jgi:single-strand DNA-binding protein
VRSCWPHGGETAHYFACIGSESALRVKPLGQRSSSAGGGAARATFRVAVSGRVRDGEQWRDGEPAFFTVVVWRDQAVHAAESLAKGSRVVVVGRLAQRSRQADDGSARSVVEVVADELGPSLRWATATTTRATRSPRSYRTSSNGVTTTP